MCFALLCLESKCSTEEGRDENNGTASEGSKAELGAERSSRTLAGRRASRSASGAAASNGTIRLAGKILFGGASTLATLANETRALTATVLEKVGGLLGESWELVGTHGDVPGLGLGRTLGRLAAALVAAVTSRDRGLLEFALESVEVLHGGDLSATDFDEAVVGVLLRVLVDETSRVDGHHVLAVDGSDLVELTGTLVATILGQAENLLASEPVVAQRVKLELTR
jgi:hypothetical protein